MLVRIEGSGNSRIANQQFSFYEMRELMRGMECGLGFHRHTKPKKPYYDPKYGGKCAFKLCPCRDYTSWNICVYDMQYFRENGEDLQIEGS